MYLVKENGQVGTNTSLGGPESHIGITISVQTYNRGTPSCVHVGRRQHLPIPAVHRAQLIVARTISATKANLGELAARIIPNLELNDSRNSTNILATQTHI